MANPDLKYEIRPLSNSTKPNVTWILEPQISDVEVFNHVEDSSCMLWPAQKALRLKLTCLED